MLRSLQNNPWLQKYFFSKRELHQLMLLFSIFGVILVLVRLLTTGSVHFLFLPWNLFLAYVPYLVSSEMQARPELINNRWKFGLLSVIWMLLIPNSFYILTDLFHLDLREESSKWYDLLLIFTFAWNGLLLGILSMRQMEQIVRHCFQLKHELLFLLPVMWMNAWGVYIGRYMRFNSWDIIANPLTLANEIGYMLIHPLRHFYPWAMVGVFAIVTTLVYMTAVRISKN